MADTRIGNFAVNNLRIVEFFDPGAKFNYGNSSELSLVSRDGYELVFKGDGFKFKGGDREPTAGTVSDVFLYDPDGHLVGRVDDVSFSLVDYYQTVAVDGKDAAFTADLMSGDDKITGGDANDRLEGYAGDDVISGGWGHDLLQGGEGDDTLSGGNGDDDLDGGAGDDRLSGGDGFDLLLGGAGNDELSGGNGDDKLYGESGDDRLSGDDGFDTLFGGEGDDKLLGGVGNDKLEGDAGNDTVEGGSGSDRVGGGLGNDVLSGGKGFDDLYGDAGNDLLRGGAGDDQLIGGAGRDTLDGGAGLDKLLGGGGADQFLFTSTNGSDLVFDFGNGNAVLAFSAAAFDNLDADFDLVVSNNPKATSNEATFLFNKGSHELFYDADGKGGDKPDLVAVLDGVNNLDKGDFLIV